MAVLAGPRPDAGETPLAARRQTCKSDLSGFAASDEDNAGRLVTPT
nr:hypothetical protein [Rhizobium sp. NXC14]